MKTTMTVFALVAMLALPVGLSALTEVAQNQPPNPSSNDSSVKQQPSDVQPDTQPPNDSSTVQQEQSAPSSMSAPASPTATPGEPATAVNPVNTPDNDLKGSKGKAHGGKNPYWGPNKDWNYILENGGG